MWESSVKYWYGVYYKRFAGGIVLVSENSQEMEMMINELNVESMKLGVRIRSMEQTKTMCYSFM